MFTTAATALASEPARYSSRAGSTGAAVDLDRLISDHLGLAYVLASYRTNPINLSDRDRRHPATVARPGLGRHSCAVPAAGKPSR